MSSAALQEILAGLPDASHLRIATTLAPARTAVPTGLAAVDELLGGGLPRGRLCEVVGNRSAGRTGLALTALSTATRRGEVVALIDLEDALDPASLEAAGADLGRVLWVRPGSVADGMRAADLVLEAGGFGLVVLDLGEGRVRRNEVRTVTSGWTRLTHGAERSGTALLVLSRTSMAGSHTVATLELGRASGVGAAAGAVFQGRPALFERIETSVRLARARFQPPGGEAVLRLSA